MADEESVQQNCLFVARAVIRDAKGVPYLLVSAEFEGDDRMAFVLCEPCPMDRVPLDVLKSLGVSEGESDCADDIEECAPGAQKANGVSDDLLIYSAAQDVEGCMYFVVGRVADLADDDDEDDEGDGLEEESVDLWIYTVASDIPPEVISSADRLLERFEFAIPLPAQPTYES